MDVDECPSKLCKHLFKPDECVRLTSVCVCSHHGNTQLMPGKAASVSVLVLVESSSCMIPAGIEWKDYNCF
jgi:hypothetical protein